MVVDPIQLQGSDTTPYTACPQWCVSLDVRRLWPGYGGKSGIPIEERKGDEKKIGLKAYTILGCKVEF